MNMDRRQFIGMAGVMASMLGGTGLVQAARAEKPNIMIVIGDDMTWRDCEPYGNNEVRTPNMARLAREGMCFDAMFTATAMCAPTRQQLYTGMFPVRNGAYPNHSKVYEGVRSLPGYLKELGYRVGLIGKTHFGPPESYPFELVKSKGGKKGASDTEAIAAFVNRDKEQPYCLVVCSNEPHSPWSMGDRTPYDPGKLTIAPYMVDCAKTREELPKYYAEITYLDGQLGDCMKTVDESGQADNTIVIFTSEQGFSLPFGKWTCYDLGLKTAFIVRWPARVKAGTRNEALTQYVDVAPTLIEAAGGKPAAIETGRPDAHGEKGFDGRSFLGVLLQKTEKHREYAYGAQTTRGIINGSACYPVRSVRSESYKLIWNLNHESVFYDAEATSANSVYAAWVEMGKSDPAVAARARLYQHRPAEELYDIKNDPYELKNLAADPAYAKVRRQLRGELERWMEQQGDEGVNAELQALERQGPNRKWKAYDPNNARAKKAKKQTGK